MAMEALNLVRQATTNQKSVAYEDGFYIFGSERIHENTNTAFRKGLTMGKAGEYYQVKELIYFLENGEDPQYIRKCNDTNIRFVLAPDRSYVKQYLTGVIDTCDMIERQETESALGTKRAADVDENDSSDSLILKALRTAEKPFATPLSVLVKPGADFSFALKLFNDTVLRPNELKKKGNTEASLSSQKRYSVPIIIIPNAITSVLTMTNVVKFLSQGQYEPVDVKAGDAMPVGGGEVTIKHMHNGVVSEFRIIDNISILQKEERYWDRVVAVFATGQAWQFKQWKWAEPVHLFQNVLGVHLMFSDSEVNSNIQSWNCKVLKISRTQRHLDAGAMNQFYKYLYDYIELNKPWLQVASKKENKK